MSHYQKDVNQINLNHITLQTLAIQIFNVFLRVLLNVDLRLHKTLLTFWLHVRQTKSVDSGIFAVTGYLPLIRKDYVTHAHGLEVYVKEYFL